MKIFTQGRTCIIEMPKEVWCSSYGQENRASVFSSSELSPALGDYKDIGRARAVVKEIFDYYRNGKKTYVMPEQ